MSRSTIDGHFALAGVLDLVDFVFSIHAIFGFARALSCMIFDARSVSRRWTSVTLLAKRVRKLASSMAESPPPTTAMSWPRKK